MFRREELAQPWKNRNLSLSCGPVTSKLTDLVESLDSIHPIVEVHVNRKSISVKHPDHPGSLAELDVDRVITEYQTYVEIEIELLEGDESLIHTLDQLIQQDSRFFPARQSKFQRALSSIGNQKREQSVFKPESWADLAHQMVEQDMNALIDAEPRAWESIDEHGVHDLRVSTRRTRAHLDLFMEMYDHDQVEQVHQHLRKLGHTLGLVRDDDVHLMQVQCDDAAQQKYRMSVLCNQAKHSEALRRQLADSFHTAIDSIERLLLTSTQASTSPWPRLHAKIKEIKRFKIQKKHSPKRLHKLRKSVKVLTYQFQAMACADPGLSPVSDSARQLQHLLGEFQDREMGLTRLSHYKQQTAVDLRYNIAHPSTFPEELTNAWTQFLAQLRRSREVQSCSKT